ncbi:MAG: transcription termination/antitermination NusG family protein [Pseudomonadota bacterium]|nr:transcription termination/antitermination NusG family protein [Pseudomonadota bacterium]
MQHSQQWYVAATKPSREGLARDQLVNQGFGVFLPMRMKTVRHARRILTRQAPLFPGYVFVGMDVETVRWRAVNATLGVKYLITRDERPSPLPRGFVEALAAAVNADGTLDYRLSLKQGDRVEIMAGPFARQVGELVSLDDRGRVAVLLNMLSGHVPVHTEVSNLLPV